MKLTVKLLDNLKPAEKEYQINTQDGMFIRILPSGVKTFWYRFTVGGKRGKLNLGNYPDTKLAEATQKHEDAKKLVRQGIDPRKPPTPEIEIQLPSPQQLTIASLAQKWLDEYSSKNHSPKWTNTLRLAIEKDIIKPGHGERLAEEIKRKDALAIIEAKAGSAPGQSKNLLKACRQMYEFAVDHELLEFNPFSNIKSKSVPALAAVHRDRVLDDKEIKHLWSGFGNFGGSTATILALRLILLTAQRPGEVTGMRWDEISWGESKLTCNSCRRCGWWIIPAERSKNGRENRVYLSSAVIDLIDKYGCRDSEYVCANIEANAIAYHVRREVQSTKKVPFYSLPRWTPHDLRRTAATGLSMLGCSDEIVDAVLNHQKQGVIKIYNRNKYDDEKREWLTKWADYVSTLI